MGSKVPLTTAGGKQAEQSSLYRAMNEALILGSLRQHELAAAADLSNTKLQQEIIERMRAEAEIRALNANLEQRVAERTAELEAANRELEAFGYSVSHDLRAPMRHIVGYMGLLQGDAGTSFSSKGQGYVTKVSEAAERMGCLIDDLLAFSRLGKSWIKKSDVNLDESVRETLVDLQEDMKGRNIAWDIHPLPVVKADQALLRLMLYNLMANAVKFTGKRAEAKIEIGCTPGSEKETIIFIRDNGAGFDPEYGHKLFGVFQRLHSETDFAGTGIGLANVQRIIQRHGGRVWAEGAVDAGATFYFSLPKTNGDANKN